jgi:hypothetical protein
MRKLWALKVGGVQIEEKKNLFCKYERFFSSTFIGFSPFLVPKQTLGQWELNLWNFIFPIFWLSSTRFQLGFNYVCQLFIR